MQALKIFLVFFVLSCLITTKSTAQLSVVFKDNTAYMSVKVDTTGKIELDKIPDSIILNFPEQDPQSFILKFNKDSSVFKVGFGCSGDNCIKLQLNDVVQNKIKLIFNKSGELIAINARYIKPEKVLVYNKKPHIVIEGGVKAETVGKQKSTGIYDALSVDAAKTPQKTLILDPEKSGSYKFYCGSLKCSDCKEKADSPCVKKPCIENGVECSKAYNFYDLVFDTSSNFYKKLQSQKVTPRYWVVYDQRDGKNIIPYYFKIHNNRPGSKHLVLKTSIAPVARKHVVYSVLGLKDSSYVIDNATAQYYEESEAKVSTVFNGITPGSKDASDAGTPKNPTDSVTSIPTSISSMDLPDISSEVLSRYRSSANLDFKFDFFNKELLPLSGLFFNNEMRQFSKKDSTTSNAMNELLDKYIEALRDITNLENENDKLIARVNSLHRKVKANEQYIKELNGKIAEKDKMIKLLKSSLDKCEEKIIALNKIIESLPGTKELSEKLYALERDLEKFNAEYDDISFIEKQYKADLLCIQLKIKSLLNISSVDNAKNLAAALIERIKSDKVDSIFYVQFARLIKDIEQNYNIAISKKIRFSIFSVSKKTSNTDEVITSLRTSNIVNPFYIDTFKTSWGLKIDFSTGVFINGLSSRSFVLSQHSFRYKERRDTINSSGAVVPIYTGVIRDTSGNLIQTNEPRISYSAGFVVHVYPRTGGFVNGGLVTGITINNSNSSPIQLMLGGSIMFNASKSSRVSLVGGITWGQVTELSTVAEPYKWKQDSDPDNKLFDSRNDIPLFYNGSSDLSTYSRWKHSWFFGVTYNFASLGR